MQSYTDYIMLVLPLTTAINDVPIHFQLYTVTRWLNVLVPMLHNTYLQISACHIQSEPHPCLHTKALSHHWNEL